METFKFGIGFGQSNFQNRKQCAGPGVCASVLPEAVSSSCKTAAIGCSQTLSSNRAVLRSIPVALSFMRTALSLSFSLFSTIFGFDAMPLKSATKSHCLNDWGPS
jgi:hypothetical protein